MGTLLKTYTFINRLLKILAEVFDVCCFYDILILEYPTTKMNIQHKDLAAGRWNSLSFCEQMANVGSEVERAIKWREKRNAPYSQMAFERALELLDLTVADEKNKKRLKELLRLR